MNLKHRGLNFRSRTGHRVGRVVSVFEKLAPKRALVQIHGVSNWDNKPILRQQLSDGLMVSDFQLPNHTKAFLFIQIWGSESSKAWDFQHQDLPMTIPGKGLNKP